MRLGVNLRFDLKRLSDAQLAALLESSWERYETAQPMAMPYRLRSSARGPIHHPLAYPFLSILSYSEPWSWGLSLAFLFSIDGLISSRTRAMMHMHLALCDIADVTDELRRRATRRKKAV
jgi:hypothetical protein